MRKKFLKTSTYTINTSFFLNLFKKCFMTFIEFFSTNFKPLKVLFIKRTYRTSAKIVTFQTISKPFQLLALEI